MILESGVAAIYIVGLYDIVNIKKETSKPFES